MAAVDGLPIRLDLSGGVVFLRAESDRDWVEHLPDGVDVIVASGSKSVRVQGIDASRSLDELPEVVRAHANEALDLMSLRSIGTYLLEEVTMPQLVWVGACSGVTVRTFSDVSLRFGGAVGGLPFPPPTSWHESMRYFRMSQTTSDLFDAFRNVYLALESILTTITPVHLKADGHPEGEGRWLRRALADAAARLQAHNPHMTFDRYRSPHAPSTANPVDDVYADLWERVRNAVFHAKSGRVFALPQRATDREHIAEALTRFGVLYADLAEPVLNARFLRSGIGPAAVEAIADGVLTGWVVAYSARMYGGESDFGAAPGEDLQLLTTARAPEYDRPFVAALRGVTAASRLSSGFLIRSVGARSISGDPMTVENFGGAVELAGAEIVEHIFTFRGLGRGLKTEYDT